MVRVNNNMNVSIRQNALRKTKQVQRICLAHITCIHVQFNSYCKPESEMTEEEKAKLKLTNRKIEVKLTEKCTGQDLCTTTRLDGPNKKFVLVANNLFESTAFRKSTKPTEISFKPLVFAGATPPSFFHINTLYIRPYYENHWIT